MGLKTLLKELFNWSSTSYKPRIEDYDVQQAIKDEGLTLDDYMEICRRLKRIPNRTELGMFGVMWSEHCCYRNSRNLLRDFPTKGPQILVGPGENAGVVDLGNGHRLAFKIESHNHPSAIEPFQGAATGVGGILRDIFTMGARPIAILNALRFGPLEDKKNIGLIKGVVEGIAHYGNCVGVPTVGGEVAFDSSYTGNPLVNAMALGLMETDSIVCSGATGIGFPVVYVGSTTGRDGMGGASFASAELTNTSLDDRPAVQVGDPFLEKGLIEACLEVFKTGDVVAAQDMGAAGLTCSCSEMASKGGLGIELDLDLVPAREEGMTPYEFLLSESQERMLFVVKPGKEEEIMNRFTRWGLRASVVGRVLKENVVRVIQNGSVAAEIPASVLAEDTPINDHELITEPPSYIREAWNWKETDLPISDLTGISPLNIKFKGKYLTWTDILLYLFDDPTIASKNWIYKQYDYQVQLNTVIPPGAADAAVIRLRPQDSNNSLSSINQGVAAVVDCPNRWCSLDPERGAMAAVLESSRNLSCVGAEPLAITNNLNFASPKNSTGYWQLAMACKGISTACQFINTPVTGGNVSLYNETRSESGDLIPIQPTPVIGMVGLVHDLNNICFPNWVNAGDLIYLLGVPLEKLPQLDNRISLGASSYLERIHGLQTGRPPELDLNLEVIVQTFIRKCIRKKVICSAHDLSDGGLAVAIGESCIGSGLGAEIHLNHCDVRIDRLLFGEGGARVIVSINPLNIKEFKQLLIDNQIPSEEIGFVTAEKELIIKHGNVKVVHTSIDKIKMNYLEAIPRRMV